MFRVLFACLVIRGVLWCWWWWVGVVGVDVVKVGALLGSASGSGFVRSVVSGGVASLSGPVVVSGLSFFFVLALVCFRRFCVLGFGVWWWWACWCGVWCSCV